MPISRLQLLMQFRKGSHALSVEQGRLARPAIPRHLRQCSLCKTRALGDERHFVFDCPHFAHIRRQFRSLYQDADDTMQCFVWHKDQKAVCHCLAAILSLAKIPIETRPHKPMLAEWTNEIFYLFLGHLQNDCEAMADSLLVLVPYKQKNIASSILKQIGILSPDGSKARAVENVMTLIANSLSAAKAASTEMARKAGSNKSALLNGQ